jgi:hypothetical protein
VHSKSYAEKIGLPDEQTYEILSQLRQDGRVTLETFEQM